MILCKPRYEVFLNVKLVTTGSTSTSVLSNNNFIARATSTGGLKTRWSAPTQATVMGPYQMDESTRDHILQSWLMILSYPIRGLDISLLWLHGHLFSPMNTSHVFTLSLFMFSLYVCIFLFCLSESLLNHFDYSSLSTSLFIVLYYFLIIVLWKNTQSSQLAGRMAFTPIPPGDVFLRLPLRGVDLLSVDP